LFVHYNLKIKVEHFCVFFDRNNVNSQWVTAGKTLGAMLYIWKDIKSPCFTIGMTLAPMF